jgi:hypothetical protein
MGSDMALRWPWGWCHGTVLSVRIGDTHVLQEIQRTQSLGLAASGDRMMGDERNGDAP